VKSRERAIRAAVIFLAIFVLPIAFLVGLRPDIAFDKRYRNSKPISLEEDPSIQIVEYGWLKGSQKVYSDGKKGTGFEAIGLAYIAYKDGESIKYRWSPHLSRTTLYVLDQTSPSARPKNVRTTITLR
jgi:hypothetical protein